MDPSCIVCRANMGRYTCPRCGIRYCSVDCYRHERHGSCAEEFYKECVLDDLKDSHIPENEKKKMMEILMRQQSDAVVDEEEELAAEKRDDLQRRLQGCDLDSDDTQDLWGRLTDVERQGFLRMVHEGKLSDIVTPWTPWWTHRRGPRPLVEEVGAAIHEEDSHDTKEACELPGIVNDIKPFVEISKRPPPECLKYNLINILYAYVYVLRKYNGDHHSLVVSCVEDIVSLSDVLNLSANAVSPCDALHRAMMKLRQIDDLFESNEYSGTVVEDVVMLLDGPELEWHSTEYIVRALSDITSLLREAQKQIAKDDDHEHDKKKLFLLEKKLKFYISWTQSFGDQLSGLIPVVVQVAEDACKLSSDAAKPDMERASWPSDAAAPRTGTSTDKLIQEL